MFIVKINRQFLNPKSNYKPDINIEEINSEKENEEYYKQAVKLLYTIKIAIESN